MATTITGTTIDVGPNKLVANSAGNVGIGTASPAKPLDVTGDIRTSTGILFGTDTAAANTLDDYEEGTWTPTTGGTNPSVQKATYTKIGNIVHISLYAVTFGNSTGTNIFGLPFTVTGQTYNAVRYHTNTANAYLYVLRANSNTTELSFLNYADAGVNLTTALGGFLVCSFSYRTG